MRKKSKQFFVTAILASMLGLTLICSVVFFTMMRKSSNEVAVFKNTSEKASEGYKEAELEIERLESECSNLVKQLETSNKKYAELETKLAGSDELYAEYIKQTEDLKIQITKRENEITKLKNTIDNLETVYSLDLNKQFDILNQLSELLENPPELEKKVKITAADGTVKEEIQKRTPKISIYYEDIAKGYKYAYDAEVNYYTASLIKAPFVLSILKEAVKEEEALNENPDMEKVYDFDKKFKYTKEYYQSGSGKIKDEPEGTEYTYLELIEYLMMYSDNVAYSVLKDEYGIDAFRSLMYELGCKSMYKTLSEVNAEDCGKIMKAIYAFIDDDNTYSEFLYNAMTKSAHSIMIVSSVYPTKAAHKYGWDTATYHDMGIVYADNPYVVVVMSDMEEGGDTVNDYVQSIIKLIAKLHANFYAG